MQLILGSMPPARLKEWETAVLKVRADSSYPKIYWVSLIDLSLLANTRRF
jgi:hypothetical protein